MTQKSNGFVAYEYQEVSVEQRYLAYCLDGYACFGWQVEVAGQGADLQGRVTLRLKRERHILNRVELTRLQRQFEAILREISTLERSRKNHADVAGLCCGLAGTAFMAGSTFAVTAATPIIWLCVVLAIPGFALWGLAYPVYRHALKRRDQEVAPLVERKFDEMYAVCEKAYRLRSEQ